MKRIKSAASASPPARGSEPNAAIRHFFKNLFMRMASRLSCPEKLELSLLLLSCKSRTFRATSSFSLRGGPRRSRRGSTTRGLKTEELEHSPRIGAAGKRRRERARASCFLPATERGEVCGVGKKKTMRWSPWAGAASEGKRRRYRVKMDVRRIDGLFTAAPGGTGGGDAPRVVWVEIRWKGPPRSRGLSSLKGRRKPTKSASVDTVVRGGTAEWRDGDGATFEHVCGFSGTEREETLTDWEVSIHLCVSPPSPFSNSSPSNSRTDRQQSEENFLSIFSFK